MNMQAGVVKVSTDIEAAGNIIDQLDASDQNPTIIIANIAPRTNHSWWLKNSKGQFNIYENGTSFCYFWVKNKLIISTIDGLTLALVKKINITSNINVIDIRKTLSIMHKNNLITSYQKNYISNSQFRSFDFIPRVVELLLKKINPISKKLSITKIPDCPNAIWWIDNFGNCKTTLFKKDIIISKDGKIQTKFGQFPFFSHLSKIPSSMTAIVEGSSGVGESVFLEFLTQGKNTAKQYSIKIGDNFI